MADDESGPPGAPVTDAFDQPIDPAMDHALRAAAKGLVRPGSVLQTEPRLGVPTFLWARAPQTTTSSSAGARARYLSAGAGRPEIAASRAALADYAPLYKLTSADVDNAVVAEIDDHGTGPILVKFRAELDGIEIFREELNVVLNRQLEAVAISGYLTSATTPAAHASALAFQLDPARGASAAIGHLAGAALDPSELVAVGSRDGYDYFDLLPSSGVVLSEPVRMKPVYFHTPGGLEAAYYVEVIAFTGAPPADTVSLLDHDLVTLEAGGYVVSAATGRLLSHADLIQHAGGAHARAAAEAAEQVTALALPPGGFTYRVWADPVTGIPHDTPAGNAPHPKRIAVPDGAQSPSIAPSDVTLPNFPFSRNDPWLLPGATETVGNNVDAFLNLLSPDNLGPVAPPQDPALGDYRAQITSAGQFLHTTIPEGATGNGALAEGRQGAIQQLFYTVNFLHDWLYDAGFDELSRNAQTNNFGRGGVGNDSIFAEAQDFSGLSNANMLTPADGGRPRMRMYVFPSPENMIDIRTPAAIAGRRPIGMSMSGPQKFDVTGDIVRATFSAAPACNVTNAAALTGKIAMFDFDNTDATACTFQTRNARLTALPTLGHLMVFQAATPDTLVNITGYVPTLPKILTTITFNTGNLIKAQLTAGQTVSVRLFRAPDRDGTLDNQIVFHEFFHYVTNRLVGNAAGLNTNQSRSMGEGWGDFASLMLTVREDDTEVASNASFNGAYGLGTWATGGVPVAGVNNGYYFGIRRYPYSTDLAKNPLTFRHITNGVALPVGPPIGFGANGANNAEVHNAGEVWTSALWDCYAGLLRDTLGDTPRLTFQQAQDRMKRYWISALKITPVSPTMLEARDAMLAVALANDLADYVLFRRAFAKRGMGSHAVAPDRLSTNHAGVAEDFVVGPSAEVVEVTVSEDEGCDQDGVVDAGEIGRVTIALHNTGITQLRATTATVSSPTVDVLFPDGPAGQFRPITIDATGTATVRFELARNLASARSIVFRVDIADPQLAGASRTIEVRVNTDELPAATATDTVEPSTTPMTTGFSATLGNRAPWERVALTPLAHAWHVEDPDAPSDQYLISPPLTVGASGSIGVAFDHAWAFESAAGDHFDGGVVEMSVNGGAFVDIGGAAYNGQLIVYAGNLNPLQGRRAFVASSAGTVRTSLSQAVAAGSTVRIRFRAASDELVGSAGWTIDNIAYTGFTERRFAQLVDEQADCAVVPVTAFIGITVDDGVTAVRPGDTVSYIVRGFNEQGSTVLAAIVDKFPTDLQCAWRCVGSGGAICNPAGTGAIIQTVLLPAGGATTFTASCRLSPTTTRTTLVNSAVISLQTTERDPGPANNIASDRNVVTR